MPKLEMELTKKLEDIIVKTILMISGNESKEAIGILEEAWELIPDEKYEYDESFHIVVGILEAAIKINDKDNIIKWKDKVLIVSPRRADSGEKEMWVGRAEYALGEFEKAREYMKIANEKSRGRCFRPKDTVYKNFFFNLE